MTKNTGRPYEALTEVVFRRLLAQADVCAKVERDVVLQGRCTEHQIDVTFEFVAGPVTYRTIIQCKDWVSAVKQEQVLAFHSVLTDIPGQPRGIMVSRSGFQEGARRFAERHGIKLYELREPEEEDWNGLEHTIALKILMHGRDIRDLKLVLDEPWLLAERSRLGVPEFYLTATIDPNRRDFRYESGAICDLKALISGLAPERESDWVPVRFRFPERVLVPLPLEAPIRYLPLLALEFDARTTVTTYERTIRLDHMVALCFRDVLTGEVRMLDAQGEVVVGGDAS